VLVYDGEIHNRQALLRQLQKNDVPLLGDGEAALFATLLEAGGPGALAAVEGGYAFAWLPGPDGPLFLGRDPRGKRPLVYAREGDAVFFASTLDGLLAMHPFPRRPDLGVLTALLRDGGVPGRRTAVEQVLRVAPGEIVGIDADLQVQSRQIPVAEREAAATFNETPLLSVLRMCVHERVMEERPAGVFLSGGVDSALVAALAREIAHVPAWSLTFPGHQSADESARTRRIGARLGLEHVLVPCPADPTPWVLGAARAFDEPCPSVKAVPAWGLARAAGRAVRVVITGVGGDRVLGGHRRYWMLGHGPWLRQVPDFIQNPVHSVLSRLDRGGERRAPRIREMPRDFRGILRFERPRVARAVFGPQLSGVAHPTARRGPNSGPALRHAGISDLDMAAQDRALRAHGLLGRHPFLDGRVLDAVTAVEQVGITGRAHQKQVLRSFVAEVLDPDLSRSAGHGFAFPADDLYRGPLRPLAQDALLGKRTRERGFVSPAGARRLLRDHVTGARNHGALVHALVMLELWARRVLDGDS
jgi:asparagine synthase (glutamine-hydrolysing)